MKTAYINEVASFLPNAPVSNSEMESILGFVGGKPSRSRNIVLRNNGIKTRYYAIDRETGKYTHNNRQLTAEAVRALVKAAGMEMSDIEYLCCGTSSPDQIKPGHGHMVHGELGGQPCEVMSAAGVCTSGMTSMKYAAMAIMSGLARKAVGTGSEFFSSFMRGSNFEPEIQSRIQSLETNPILAFEKDFLRWMLSDGAGAVLITPEPNKDKLSLRIDWIDFLSYAGELPVCMYTGGIKKEDGYFQGWREASNQHEIVQKSYFAVKQDTRILDESIVEVSVRALLTMASKRGLRPEGVTWFLPHYSSEYFRMKFHDRLASAGFPIPIDRWFTNLTSVGNTGAASIYLMMDELVHSGKLKKGDTLLGFIPESGRFCICYILLTVV